MLLLLALVFGLGAAAATVIIRELAPITVLLRKPVSCDLCMSWWLSVFHALAFGFMISNDLLVLFCILPSMFISMVALKLIVKISRNTNDKA